MVQSAKWLQRISDSVLWTDVTPAFVEDLRSVAAKLIKTLNMHAGRTISNADADESNCLWLGQHESINSSWQGRLLWPHHFDKVVWVKTRGVDVVVVGHRYTNIWKKKKKTSERHSYWVQMNSVGFEPFSVWFKSVGHQGADSTSWMVPLCLAPELHTHIHAVTHCTPRCSDLFIAFLSLWKPPPPSLLPACFPIPQLPQLSCIW